MSDGKNPSVAIWRRLTSGLDGPPRRPRYRPLAEIVLPLAVAVSLSWGIRVANLDLGSQQWIFRQGGAEWSLGEHPFWKWLYYGGTAPAALVVLGAAAGLFWSGQVAALRAWRRIFVFLILAGLIGPGLLTNGLVKEYWGRPRPRELVEFGGRSNFEPVLHFDAASEGLSFPCGHATMGFYFLAFYFLWRRHRPALALAAVFGSLAAGGLMGVARMLQGAHFLSDSVWAAVICWFTPMALYHALGLDRRVLDEVGAPATAMPLWKKGAIAAGAVGILAAVGLATPYDERWIYTPLQAHSREGALRLRLVLAEGRVEVVPGSQWQVEGEAYGHGFPTSKIGRNSWELERPDGSYVVYSERISGWFKELSSRRRIEVPWDRTRQVELESGSSEVRIQLSPGRGRLVLKLAGGSGEVVVETGDRSLSVTTRGSGRVVGSGSTEIGPDAVRLELAEGFTGTVKIETGK